MLDVAVETRHDHWQASGVMQMFPAIAADVACGEVYELLSNDDAKFAVAVVDKGCPVGIVGRLMVLDQFARLYRREVFARRPVTKIMDCAPLVVDAALPIDALSRLIATEKPGALHNGIIVVRDGRYVGICSGIAVLDRVAEQAREQAEALSAARDAAEVASRAKSAFLANVSHELRTPLNAILGFSELIRLGIHGAMLGKYVDYANDIWNSGQMLLELINELLDLSKAEAGRLELCEEEFEVHVAVAECFRMVHERARSMGHRLTFSAGGGLPALQADRRMIRQMLLNLLSNAIKFTPPGGSISVDARLLADRAFELTVGDNGIGIAPGDIARVLEPFTQIDNKHNRKYEGTGLGLPLVKRLVELHGGVLTIDSELGAGTRVVIRFPPARTVADASDCQQPDAAPLLASA